MVRMEVVRMERTIATMFIEANSGKKKRKKHNVKTMQRARSKTVDVKKRFPSLLLRFFSICE